MNKGVWGSFFVFCILSTGCSCSPKPYTHNVICVHISVPFSTLSVCTMQAACSVCGFKVNTTTIFPANHMRCYNHKNRFHSYKLSRKQANKWLRGKSLWQNKWSCVIVSFFVFMYFCLIYLFTIQFLFLSVTCWMSFILSYMVLGGVKWL